MARPRKDDSELKAPRRLKTPDGKPLLARGRPPKDGAKVQVPLEDLKRIMGVAPPEPDVPVEMTSFTPLEYALHVMNDPRESKDRRDRLAVAAMPYVHAKVGEGGKKEKQADNAKKASAGKFAIAQPPRLKAVS